MGKTASQEKLIILSDLWGHPNNTWLVKYTSALSSHFHIQNLDSCLLAQCPPKAHSETARHQHFVNGGIDIAVLQLANLISSPTALLAFSIGGTIAWKAGLRGLPITKLFALSATRLRYETQAPSFPIHLTYGSLDPYRPKPGWFQQLALNEHVLEEAKHDFYADPAYIPDLLQDFQNF